MCVFPCVGTCTCRCLQDPESGSDPLWLCYRGLLTTYMGTGSQFPVPRKSRRYS